MLSQGTGSKGLGVDDDGDEDSSHEIKGSYSSVFAAWGTDCSGVGEMCSGAIRLVRMASNVVVLEALWLCLSVCFNNGEGGMIENRQSSLYVCWVGWIIVDFDAC